jgi:hypothetical protein
MVEEFAAPLQGDRFHGCLLGWQRVTLWVAQ